MVFFTLVFLFLVLSGSLFFYFTVWSKRSDFPSVQSTVNTDELTKSGFRQIKNDESKFSYFIPQRWTETDRKLSVYGDVLTGAHVYMKSYPNSLGKLTNDVCGKVGQGTLSPLSATGIYLDLKLVTSNIKKIGDFTGCYAEYTSTIAKKNYQIGHFYIFRKNSIYVLHTQFQSGVTQEQQLVEIIERSIIISE